jgi:UDP-N-acetylglucosamine 2-epimerase (non-hydrolysing)
MKVAPVLEAVRAGQKFDSILVHTGQHYDANMSDIFFSDLDMPQPDRFLGIGSGSHAEQTAKVMIEMERLLEQERPDLVMVAGDVNSTLATALVAAKAGIALGHIEAGLRSFDRSMPEEINRIVADEFSQFCFVTEPSGLKNLEHEGISKDRVFFVGNTMIDSVQKYLPKARERFPELAERYGIRPKEYALVTLHRPSNVDKRSPLESFVELFERIGSFTPRMTDHAFRIIFPVHPRTRKRLEEFGLSARVSNNLALILIDPVGYLDFLALQANAALVLTDSGGIQEETTALGVPCITLRENTERPITVEEGTNEMLGTDLDSIIEYSKRAYRGQWKAYRIPNLWDGKASLRIAKILEEKF